MGKERGSEPLKFDLALRFKEQASGFNNVATLIDGVWWPKPTITTWTQHWDYQGEQYRTFDILYNADGTPLYTIYADGNYSGNRTIEFYYKYHINE